MAFRNRGRRRGEVWLRGGWAKDFSLGRVTRDHEDVDWFVLESDSDRLTEALMSTGFEDITTAPKDQQVDLIKDQIEIKQMVPVWNPRLVRRPKDTADIAELLAEDAPRG